MTAEAPEATGARPRLVFGAQRDLMLPAWEEVRPFVDATLVRRPEELTAALLDDLRPAWVVLPDWSWIVPPELLARASFVGFHAADLPDYRGGSPLQHQILDGLVETKLTMFRMEGGLDAGPILLQAPLSLEGTISEVWRRIVALVPGMVARLVAGDVEERPQRPGGFVRKRRRPAESEIPDLSLPLDRLYDLVRALDDPYPNAFVRTAGKRLAFRRPRRDGAALVCEVVVTEDPDPSEEPRHG